MRAMCHQSATAWWLSHFSEKYESVSWDDEIPNIWEKKMATKPPTIGLIEVCKIYLFVFF